MKSAERNIFLGEQRVRRETPVKCSWNTRLTVTPRNVEESAPPRISTSKSPFQTTRSFSDSRILLVGSNSLR
ncbi:hypothetical protein ABFV05_010612 [Capra hircus]